MDGFNVDFHHGGYFDGDKYEGGELTNWTCDGDRWSYFEILGVVKEMKYEGVLEMWYDFAGTLKPLEDDFGAIEALNWSKTNGKVKIYIVHPISQPEIIVTPEEDQTEAQFEAQTEAQFEAQTETQPEAQNDNQTETQPEAQNDNQTETQPEAQNDDQPEAQNDDQHDAQGDPQVDVQPEIQTDNQPDSDDSALGHRFDDSDDEVLNDGFDEVLVEECVQPVDEILVDETPVSRKRKGGRPKTSKRAGSSKKHKGRPKKKKVSELGSREVDVEPPSDEDVLEFGVRERSTGKRSCNGLSDSDYVTEELESQDEMSSDYSDEGEKAKHPSFVAPKNFNDYKWVLGTLFSTKEEFKEAVASYAVHNGRDLRFVKNDKTRVRVGCKEGCGWVALCSKLSNEDTWQLRTLNDKHTCNREFNVRMFNTNWLGKKLYSTVRINPHVKLTAICEKVHEKWNAGMNRMKAYRARKAALNIVEGSFKEQYRRLYDYTHELLKSNPNSTIKLNVQATEHQPEEHVSRPLLPSFHRLYMCLDACKKSFRICRPIIGVDGCFLKGNYGGQILAAVGRDPNDQMLPIAVAVVEAETKDSWAWFFELLVQDLGGPEICKNITFISDQQKGLLPALEELLPGVDQRFCVRHLYSNFRKKFPGKQLKEIMWRAAKATYPQAWEREMREMRKVNEEAYKHLLKVPPRFWSKSMFKYRTKSDVLVNNMSETFNSVILGARQKPIVTMLEEIRGYLMDRWATNRAKIEDYSESVLPRIKKGLERRQEISRFFIARLSGDMIYEVRHTNMTGEKYTVDLKKFECSCRSWMLTGIPCYHAISCIQSRSESPTDYIPSYYRKDTYQACYQPLIYPTNGENLWELTPYPDILPPPTRRAPGRPKRRRNKDADEKRNDATHVSRKGLPNKCRVCGMSGHNKASCPAAPRQSQTVPNVESQTATNVESQTATNVESQTVQSQPISQTVQSQPIQRMQTRQSSLSQPQVGEAPTTRVQTRQTITIAQLLAMRRARQGSTAAFQPPTSQRPKLAIKRKGK
ncbi:uncharacterized protein LOC131633723 [Vicia villosa]|uniref:uncharacterized protein LOC131633723 n=1 Tax=Vicia villosa TaxID=3911 RepID=UPI00273BD444|nr:uncharacterized protein LOC131633723 [Vicia villosa]